jgi:D-glycero-alpha-D-manno-heptose-7-phosphate kinase
MKNFSDFLINANATIKEAMFKISKNSKGVVYVKNSKEQIVASITDGDIRRYLLNNGKIIDKVTSCFNKNYKFIKNSNISERDQILKLLDQKYKLIPVLNESKKLVDLIDNNYKAIIDKTVIVRSRSPARISLAGGGTDVTKFFFEQGATGISFTINKYCNVHLIRRGDQKIVIYSRDFNKKIIYENINFLNYNGKLDLIKASIKLLNPDFGFEIYIETDIKPGSGLGGSAAVSSAYPPISPIMTIPYVSGSTTNFSKTSMKLVPLKGSPPIPTTVDCPSPALVVWSTAS